MSLRHILISLFLLGGLQSYALDSLHLKLQDSLSTFAIDAKGNFYVADISNTLYKFDASGKQITKVSTKVNGDIHSIDCSNPFELYVYYKAQNVLQFFDNMLNLRGSIALNDLGYTNITAVARSFDNNIWFFDLDQFALVKMSKERTVISTSDNLSLNTDKPLAPYQIIEAHNSVYLADTANGILIFDLFGTYLKTLHLDNHTALDVSGSKLFTLTGDSVLSYDTKELELKLTPSPLHNILHLQASNKRLYFCTRNNIFSYQHSK